jgi:hypothetical protein
MARWVDRQRNNRLYVISPFEEKGKNASLIFAYTLAVFILASAMFFASSVRSKHPFS